jgi:hypothetical protein
LIISNHPLLAVFVFLVFYLGGVGVRERSSYAAGCVLAIYVIDTFVSGAGIVRVLFAALLLANFRAIWIASHWRPDSEEAAPAPRWSESWSDKFADQLPMWLWPKIRIPYYVLSICYLLLSLVGIAAIVRRRT